MIKNIFDGRVETTITTEKAATCFKRNTIDIWKKYEYFNQQACLKWAFFMSIRPINLTRTIRKCIIVFTPLLGRSLHASTNPPPPLRGFEEVRIQTK